MKEVREESDSILSNNSEGDKKMLKDSGNSYRANSKLPDSLIETARYLRKHQTEAEELLWELLRNRQLNGYKFRRQHPVKPGFVLDFYCARRKLAVEVDGAYHDSHQQQLADEERTEILNKKDIEVVRFYNVQVLKNPKNVLQEIADRLDSEPSP